MTINEIKNIDTIEEFERKVIEDGTWRKDSHNPSWYKYNMVEDFEVDATVYYNNKNKIIVEVEAFHDEGVDTLRPVAYYIKEFTITEDALNYADSKLEKLSKQFKIINSENKKEDITMKNENLKEGLEVELGKDFREIELQDDETEFGGIAFAGETLGDFLAEIDYMPKSLAELNEILKESGIKEIKKVMDENIETNSKSLSEFIKEALEDLQNDSAKTWYFSLGTTENGTELYYVMSLCDAEDFDKEDVEKYLRTNSDKTGVVCGKIAVNSDDLQYDYDYDWTMPYEEDTGNVYDTDYSIDKTDEPEQIAKEVMKDLKNIIELNIDRTGRIQKESMNLTKNKRVLKESVSEEAYEVAEIIDNYFGGGLDKPFENVSRDDFDEEFAIAVRKVFEMPEDKEGLEYNVWEHISEVLPNGDNVLDFESDVRGILNYKGWETIYEGENEGGLKNHNIEKPKKNKIIHDALVEYERNHYESENDDWQEIITDLIDYYSRNELEESCKTKKIGGGKARRKVMKEELDTETMTEVEEELIDILKEHPQSHNLDVEREDIKEYVKKRLKEKGYEVEISGNDLRKPMTYHIEYFKKTLKEAKSNKDEDLEESCKTKKNRKTLKEEYGAYSGEPFCDEIANRLEDGFWSDETENGTSWELEINGMHRSEFMPSFADYLAEEVSYPVRDGHLNYMDIEMVLYKSSLESIFGYDDLERFVPDLVKLGVDREDINEWLKDTNPDAMLDIYYDYDINFDVDEWEVKNNLSDEVELSIYDIDYVEGETEPEELEEMISDYLSDTYGYTHKGFNYDVDGDTIYVYGIEWDLGESYNLKNKLVESFPKNIHTIEVKTIEDYLDFIDNWDGTPTKVDVLKKYDKNYFPYLSLGFDNKNGFTIPTSIVGFITYPDIEGAKRVAKQNAKNIFKYLEENLNKNFDKSLNEAYIGNIEEDLQKYCDLLLTDLKNHYPNSRDTYTFKKGNKYYKIIENTPGESVHAFVDMEGNVYKPESWNKPAKGIRTTLQDILKGNIKVDWAGGYLYKRW